MDTEQAARAWAAVWASAWPRQGRRVDRCVIRRPRVLSRACVPRAGPCPDYLRRVFAEESDITCRFGEPLVSGRRAVVEWWASWIEEGRPITLAGVTMLRFDDEGKVVDHRDYWNQGEGRIEPYAGW